MKALGIDISSRYIKAVLVKKARVKNEKIRGKE